MIRDTLIKISKEYQTKIKEPYKENPYQTYLQKDVRNLFLNSLKDILININVSVVRGMSKWSDIAWIAFLHENVTDSTTKGYYPAYLFSEDSKQFELVLTQGTYKLEDEYIKKGKGKIVDSILNTRALILRGKLVNDNNNYSNKNSIYNPIPW